MSLPELPGLLTADDLVLTAGTIAEWQLPNGMIPWFPGGHADPRVLDVYTQTRKKLKAAGKAFWGDVTESVTVTSVVQAAATDLLERHGRKSGLTF